MSNKNLTDSRVANLGANAIFETFKEYKYHFKQITQKARLFFISRDWQGGQANATRRLELYKTEVEQIVIQIRLLLEGRLQDRLVWASMKAVYSGLITGRDDWELAETFFNSVSRQIFTTVGLDAQVEFVDTDFEIPPTPSSYHISKIFEGKPRTADLIEDILTYFDLGVTYLNLAQTIQTVSRAVEDYLQANDLPMVAEQVEMVKSVFYRGKGAYLVGRINLGQQTLPFVLALLHPPEGLVVDAVLLNENDVNILFSFTRSYFKVYIERPYDLVRFLKTIMPRKRIHELYTSIGYNKHGKTELYRDLLHHLASSTDQFEIASGERGMVMIVFTLPSYDVVFKLIKDHFAYPKNTTRKAVMNQYHRVFQHDRAGRLIDAQEFEHLKFERKRFSPALLEELLAVAAQTVSVEDEYVVIKHAYIERRVSPLNIYIRQADQDAARAAAIDCGQAIKDLAGTNIFTGDMLLKNFGVTRHGRVVFYDYDELTSLTNCTFRDIPEASNNDEEMSAEPWYAVAENDVFPEEFERFLAMPQALRKAFMERHADLFTVEYWTKLQEWINDGKTTDIFPYGQSKRLTDFVTRPDQNETANIALTTP